MVPHWGENLLFMILIKIPFPSLLHVAWVSSLFFNVCSWSWCSKWPVSSHTEIDNLGFEKKVSQKARREEGTRCQGKEANAFCSPETRAHLRGFCMGNEPCCFPPELEAKTKTNK